MSTGGNRPRKRASKARASSGGDGDWRIEIPYRDPDGRLSVLLELSAAPGVSGMAAFGTARGLDVAGVDVDEEFAPVAMGAALSAGTMGPMGAATAPTTHLVRAKVDSDGAVTELRARPDVLGAWWDTPVVPFPRLHEPQVNEAAAAAGGCPIPPCDCSPGTAHGNLADVANYLGAAQLWSSGLRGTGVVVGVVDGGITAVGRPVAAGETTRRIPRVVGGWPVANWGTQASAWGEHGNMCSTDVLGMAPDANIYDLRISGAPDSVGTVSRALQAFQWAIDRHRVDGTPQILTNSWGIFQEAWDATYARDPNHPFTRKVVEAIGEGILVLFAAGNCGATCPDNRCGGDTGPGRSIWGANSHPLVMTVGAVNKDEQFVGYSSQGPGALDPNKPDFCSVTHFAGYFGSDTGTSAATPILAGCVALLKQAVPAATQAQVKGALRATAKDIGPGGFDQHSGAGIVRIGAALRVLRPTLHSRLPRCQPSRLTSCASASTPCLSSRGIRCVASAVTPCISRFDRCLVPSRDIPCISRWIDCIPSVMCPSSFHCGSLVCGPVPEPIEEQAGWQGGPAEYWYDDEAVADDPVGGWYGGG